jgi:hypothetical protein
VGETGDLEETDLERNEFLLLRRGRAGICDKRCAKQQG